MSKAEEFAYSKYPKSKKGVLYDLARNSIIQGYHQAEKDLELSLEDMMAIDDLLNELLPPRRDSDELVLKGYYEEILKRFKDLKK